MATFATPGNLERPRHGCGEDSSHWISSRFRILLRLLGWGMNRSLASLFTTCSGFLKVANTCHRIPTDYNHDSFISYVLSTLTLWITLIWWKLLHTLTHMYRLKTWTDILTLPDHELWSYTPSLSLWMAQRDLSQKGISNAHDTHTSFFKAKG